MKHWIGLFQKIFTTPLWTALNWVPTTLRISKKDSGNLCRIPNPADSKSWGTPEICMILNGFLGSPVKIHKFSRKCMEFQSSSPSIYYMSSMGGVWTFSGIAHCDWLSPASYIRRFSDLLMKTPSRK